MSKKAVKTEHCGPKRARGGFVGRKRDAKSHSARARRENDKKAANETD